MSERRPWFILPVIVLSQFASTSLWFAANAILGDLRQAWNLDASALGYMTSAVQLGFIFGTLLFALLTLADRVSPRLLFLVCALLGSLCNLMLIIQARDLVSLLGWRFLTGFFLAGIYPVGMKIAAGWFRRDLGRAIGWLVGALVLGTALPHLLKAVGGFAQWTTVIAGISIISAAGGLAILLVPEAPPAAPTRSAGANPPAARAHSRGPALIRIFRERPFRAAALGYFGHMWELYTFWAFLPMVFAASAKNLSPTTVSAVSFSVIAAGFAGCVLGGVLSFRLGSARVACIQLALSGLCCLASPLFFDAPPGIYIAFLILWGVFVVGDSPQFSTLTARTAPPELMGTALTITVCLGFALTVVGIQTADYLMAGLGEKYIFLLLVPGPVIGLLAMRPLLTSRDSRPHGMP